MLRYLLHLALLWLVSCQRGDKQSEVEEPYPQQTGFVRVFDGRFVTDDCREYLFAGFNAWELIEVAIGFPKALPENLEFLGNKNLLEYLFDISQEVGMNVIRLFGHGTTAEISTQRYCCVGDYKEEVLQGLDYILDEAAQRDLKVILTFGDNWRPDFPDTVQYYVNQSETATERDDFWFDETTKQLYKNHIEFMTNRENTFNGRLYKNDPTIFAWNVINEPRCGRQECLTGNALSDWINEMAEFIKEQDPNHMVTVGEEGFYSGQGCDANVNPGEWAAEAGQNSPVDHYSEYIDFVGSHVWPDNWGRLDFEFMQNWIQAKQDEAKSLGKPLLLEEFGKATDSMFDTQEIAAVRDPIYKEVFETVQNSLDNGGALRGALFWTLNYGQPHDKFFGYGITIDDSTWQQVREFASDMGTRRANAEVIDGCEAGRGPVFYSSQPRTSIDEILVANAYECCDGNCNSLYGWLTGDVVSVIGPTDNAQECCDACTADSACTGYNWCSCRGGCAGFDHKTCILKALPFPILPQNDTQGENRFFLGGVPEVDTISHGTCQLDAGCAGSTTCSETQYFESVKCPAEECNAGQINYGGDLVTLKIARRNWNCIILIQNDNLSKWLK
eukprot:TRINITY_DN1878_c1_g1_i5.p1 TRINITY_DN1878_c1_g1~~TRINITY_DN1878_c1_g1_i5.p1  ORF type:complete len:615 (+),score=98.81 TRINITY_DN1878_c1_g1_i5:117-1961(+)